MDAIEDVCSNQSKTDGENHLPHFMLNYDDKSMHNDNYLKVNGDHNMPQHIFPSDDESSASTHTSSSSRNLVIDHEDDNSKESPETKRLPPPAEPQEKVEDEKLVPHSSNGDNGTSLAAKKHTKRKLSLRDTSNAAPSKKRRISKKPVDMSNLEKKLTDSEVVQIPQTVEDAPNNTTDQVESRKVKGAGPIREYANYLGLKPATIPIKCFKCSSSNFKNLNQLRDHQKICLFKDKQRSVTTSADSKHQNPPKHMENKNNEHQSSNSLDILHPYKPKQIVNMPGTNTIVKAKKRVFLCSACGTYYENWNLFLHMREVHKRHICLYCIGMFPSAERLTFHLEMKHDLEQNHFDCQEKLLRSSRDSCYLMCCVCEHLFTEHEDFTDHKCSDHQQPCTLCGQKGRHSVNCKAGAQLNKSKHKDNNHVKRKGKGAADRLHVPSIGIDLALNKPVDPVLNGGDKHEPEPSILRRIITEGDSVGTKSKCDEPPSTVKVNGCSETTTQAPVRENDSHAEQEYTLKNMDSGIGSINGESNDKQENTIFSSNILPIDNDEPPPLPPTLPKYYDPYSEQNKPNESFDSSLSQSNTASEITSRTHSSPEKELNDSVKSSDVSQTVDTPAESKPLFVPKFKIRIPKEFQTPLESEQSSTESDDNEGERSENEDEEQSDGSDMDIDEEIQQNSARQLEENVDNKEKLDEENKKNEEENMEVEEKKEIESDFVSSELLASPVASPKPEVNESITEQLSPKSETKEEVKIEEEDDKVMNELAEADEDIPLQELLLQQPLDKIDMIEFLRICLRTTFRICLYCNHARRIAVNGHNFTLHLISSHRFSATVDSITAEELQPATIVQKLKSFLSESEEIYFNLETYGGNDKENLIPYEKLFECFQCRFETRIHKELYLHNRKMHLKTAILCFMCRSNFFSYSEILCHMCPGVANKFVIFDIKFRCCLCDLNNIPSSFRLMVHLRKKHFACDVCLENCFDQSRLSSHVWKHKLHHLCYRCGIAYRNKPDITKHLFWKHGTESVLCKRCLQKRWPHVYHFCIPPASFVCEVCNLSFSRAMALKVHKRLHSGDAPYPCPEDECDLKFISRKLLLKHTARHNEPAIVPPEEPKEDEKEEMAEQPQQPTPSAVESEEIKTQDVSENKVNEEDVKGNNEQEHSKKKRKRSKKGKDNVDDLIHLPALNLSESDSSDESDGEKSKSENVSTPIPQVMLSPASETDADQEMGNSTETQIMDIWENFKTFQASQAKTNEDESDDNVDAPAPPILHVTQSDHDYCLMFKPISKLTKSASKDDLNEIKTCNTEAKELSASPKKKQKSPRKAPRSGSDSSSSGSSSSSDSSCSCGSNCSCSSSSGSSSDSSSSSDSDSSSSEGKRRAAARREAKLEKKNRSKEEGAKPEEVQVQSPKANTSDIVDVVTTDPKQEEIVDPDTIILESDLETDESDTDEDFYDEHPQKMANQLLADKRKQLLMQTSLSPSHNFDFVENSRPSTPSIPEELIKEKKVKIKKKKRDKKTSKPESIPTFKLDDNPTSLHNPLATNEMPVQSENPQTPLMSPNSDSNAAPVEDNKLPLPPSIQQPIISNASTIMPAPISLNNRLSTGSSSDQDASLKRSKRRRRPNKFYGYSSDDDGSVPGTAMSNHPAFKPTPPPILTWRKEDLPAPSSKSSSQRNQKSPAVHSKKSHVPTTPTLPPIPPIIIRPSDLLSKKPLSVENAPYKPPIVQPIRVPPVPVHHIRPPQYISPSRSFDDSDSSSDDDHRLTIMTPVVKKTTKGTGSRAKQPRARQKKQQQQQQQQQIQQPQPPPQPIFQEPQPVYQPSNSQVESAVVPTASVEPKRIPPALLPNPDATRIEYFRRNNIRYPIQPPAGARPPREGESVYCYCRCPYDEVSEMIACDGDDCMIEWFHFECVGILVPPQGKWFCPECRPLYPNEAFNIIGNT